MPSLARFYLLSALLAASHLWIVVQQLWQPRADRSGGPCLSLASLFLFKLTSNLSFFFFALAARFLSYNNNIIVSTIHFEVNVVLLKINGNVARRKKRAHRLE